MIKIRHGFPGERITAWPYFVMESTFEDPLFPGIAVHSMGFFPHAYGHFIDRPSGRSEYILIYCTKGKGFYVLDGQYHEVSEGRYFILPAGIPHRYGASESEPWHIYWAHFVGPKAGVFYDRMQGLRTLSHEAYSRSHDLEHMFDEMLNVMETRTDPHAAQFVNAGFLAILSSFLHYEVFMEAGKPPMTPKNVKFINRITHYMSENIDRSPTVEDMAGFMGYSVSHFHRLFLRETGMAPMEYFARAKVEAACSLLRDTRLKVNQISMKLGFQDPYYFSRFFTKRTGISPRRWRESLNNPHLIR